MSILEEIARERLKAVEEEKKLLSLLELERLLEEREALGKATLKEAFGEEVVEKASLKNEAQENDASSLKSLESVGKSFYQALAKKGLSIIGEVKKASPSKGIIAEDFPYLQIAKDYEAAGIDAISCLTEPKYFLGKDQYLQEIAQAVSVPVLRKDFLIDPYQIYQAKLLGAKAILLIVSLLGERELKEFLSIAGKLGLDALVECHDEEEIRCALSVGAEIIGVNNRNLKTFSVNMENSLSLRNLVPKGQLFVAESGMSKAEELRLLEEAGVDGVLIGESLMRAESKKEKLQELRSLLR